ncbi:hypothetical protein, partial [Geomonas propionica]
YTVTGTASGPGSVTPASTQVNYGGSTVLTATPNSGAVVTGVTGGTATVSGSPATFPSLAPVTVTISNVTSPRAVAATFAAVGVDAGVAQTAMVITKVTLRGTMQG